MPGRFSFPIEQATPSYAALPTSPLNGLAERDLDLGLLALDDLSPVRGRQDLGLAVVGDDFQHAVVLDLVPAALSPDTQPTTPAAIDQASEEPEVEPGA